MFFFFGQNKVSEEEYISLKAQREEIKSQIDMLTTKLWDTESRFELLESIFDPKIRIMEVNNQSMGHRYIGRLRLNKYVKEKPIWMTVSLPNASEYKGKDDPELMKFAKEKAREKIKRLYPELF